MRFAVENLACAYDWQPLHVARVRDLALQLFDQLRPLHGYGAWERELLAAAATLHDIGVALNYDDQHKHAAYTILNAPLPGYAHREIAIIALLARYHWKGTVEPGALRDLLSWGDEQRGVRLAALLRIAACLERSKRQVVCSVRCSINGRVRIATETLGDAALEIWEANRQADLFRTAFGVDALIE